MVPVSVGPERLMSPPPEAFPLWTTTKNPASNELSPVVEKGCVVVPNRINVLPRAVGVRAIDDADDAITCICGKGGIGRSLPNCRTVAQFVGRLPMRLAVLFV